MTATHASLSRRLMIAAGIFISAALIRFHWSSLARPQDNLCHEGHISYFYECIL